MGLGDILPCCVFYHLPGLLCFLSWHPRPYPLLTFCPPSPPPSFPSPLASTRIAVVMAHPPANKAKSHAPLQPWHWPYESMTTSTKSCTLPDNISTTKGASIIYFFFLYNHLNPVSYFFWSHLIVIVASLGEIQAPNPTSSPCMGTLLLLTLVTTEGVSLCFIVRISFFLLCICTVIVSY